ncbi:rabenosyn-5-like [Ruditapes philippinarum]|uniref:rabenosyn-5-like n=1 Tax=Ruditapes philippinarum TaxID=129788 RepID=UPI00295AF75F|nr:rabenosyn-5-like [Ruditapes philippinarum]
MSFPITKNCKTPLLTLREVVIRISQAFSAAFKFDSLFSSEGDPHIRACEECRKLLERRDQQMETAKSSKSALFYCMSMKMKMCIQECEVMLENYLPMVESLSLGESTYSLSTAQRRRQELVKKYEIIDQISKRIALLDSDKEEGLSPKEALLQKSIRVYASNFMQENMMGLQNLPSEEQYKKLQQKHTAEVQRQIAIERQAVQQAQAEEKKMAEKEKHGTSSRDDERPSAQKHSRNKSDGWKPTEHNVKGTDEDPMLQQMEIIRVYIQQAKQAKKWDEVNMLEQNLKDLQKEYSSQQKQTWS